MIFWLLGAIRHPLLVQLESLQRDHAVLQDRLEQADQERRRLWEQNKELLAEMVRAHHMQINLEWQKNGAPAPHPEAPHLPANMVHSPDNTPLPPRHSQGSQFVEDANREFKKQWKVRQTAKPQ